jgi:hypothetical protein
MIAAGHGAHGVSHPTIYRYLRRYWQRGQTPNALLPDYGNSGGRGKVRQSSAGVKRGRPRKNAAEEGAGLNADEEIRRTFASPRPLCGCQCQVLAVGRLPADAGRLLRRAPHRCRDGARADVRPGQRDCLPSASSTTGSITTTTGRRKWRAVRPASVASTAAAGAVAAAGRVPVAGGTARRRLLSGCGARRRAAGVACRPQAGHRPAGGVCGHRFFSRAGVRRVYRLGEAQWPQAMLALANCGADKQRYASSMAAASRRSSGRAAICRKRCSPTPADAGWSGDTLLNNFNCAAWRWTTGRTTGARCWKSASACWRRRQGAPCRLDGVLDLEQFTRIVVDCILYYNSRQPLAHAGNATPRQLWEWGREHRGGGLKIYPEHLIRCSLMPVAQAR